MNTLVKSQIVIYSDPNFLALSVLKDLVEANYFITIITADKKSWINKTGGISNQSAFTFTSTNKYSTVSNFSYALFLGGFISRSSSMHEFKKFISNSSLGSAKTLAIFPLDALSDNPKKTIAVNRNAGIVYVGDLLGNGLDLNSDQLMPTLISEMIGRRTLTLGVGELFFPVLVTNVSKNIVKLLSLPETYGKRLFLLGAQTSSRVFWKENIKHFPNLRIIYDTHIITRALPRQNQIRRQRTDLNAFLNTTYQWLIKNKNLNQKQKPVVVKPIKPKKKLFPRLKFIRPLLLTLFCILILPIITLLISSGVLYISYRYFLAGKNVNSQKSALIAKAIFVISGSESRILAKIPVLQLVYKETAYVAYLGTSISDAYVNMAPLLSDATTLFNNILGTGVYDLKVSSFEMKSLLDYMYRQINLVQVETTVQAKENVLVAKQIANLIDFDKYKNIIHESSVIVGNLPTILGVDENKSYLVLFQNNMELRPTGGFIGSYGILDFSGGRLNALTVNDIYSADGQLKGHIEPPVPIKDYLGEANWFFRDSNWNPDFSVSAPRAEWFLNKEMEQQVDGTIAIDLSPIKNILKFTGPVFLPDYNLTITENNLYEKTQQEAQSNFFPGSRKKASFLTALSRVLLSEITKMDSKQKLALVKSIYSSFESRSLQIHLNEKTLQESIDRLGWSGGISSYSCGNDCYSDFFGDVEANLGVNKANYFIDRKMDFSVQVTKTKITRNLNIDLSNRANRSLGPSGQYKVYLRLLIPQDANLIESKLVSGQGEEQLTPSVDQVGARQEIGFYVEVLPGENKRLSFSWDSDIQNVDKISKYGLFVRKQAGTNADPLKIQLHSSLPNLTTQPVFTLTKEGTYTYNTTLSKDFFARISF